MAGKTLNGRPHRIMGRGATYRPPTRYDRRGWEVTPGGEVTPVVIWREGERVTHPFADRGERIDHYSERVAVERRYLDLAGARAEIEGAMRIEPWNGGAYLDPAPSTIGAGEVRVSERVRVRPSRSGVERDTLDPTGEWVGSADDLRDGSGSRSQGDYDRLTLPVWLAGVLYDFDRDTREAILRTLPRERVEGVEVEVGSRRSRVEVEGVGVGDAYLDRLNMLGADLSLAGGDA